jgi:hypothetical protein
MTATHHAMVEQCGFRDELIERWSRGGVASSPLVEPDMQISRIRLARKLFHR